MILKLQEKFNDVSPTQSEKCHAITLTLTIAKQL